MHSLLAQMLGADKTEGVLSTGSDTDKAEAEWVYTDPSTTRREIEDRI